MGPVSDAATGTATVRPTSRTRLAVLGLLGVTAAWGSTFYLIKDVVERVPVSDFLAVRFALAAAAVWLIAPRCVAALSPAERRNGVLLGLLYGGGQLLQTVGLQTTAASVSGFITGMYVVFTPLLGALLLRARIGRTVWVAVLLATAGLAVLSLRGLAIGTGEALTLASAVLYAAHIIGLGVWSTARTAIGLTVVQLLTITVVCAAAAAPGGVVLPERGADWAALVYMALVAGALALVVQTWAQAHLDATRAAIIMTMEPVWAGLFAVLLGGERLGARVVLGGSMVLAAMYLVELGPRRPGDQDVAEEVGGVPHVGPV
jgi:drug/metabolite transporter (DMT)-like permease